MARYDIDDSTEGCFDITVEVDFLGMLDTENMAKLRELTSELLEEGFNSNRFEEVVSVQINPDKMSLQLRYFTKPKLISLGKQHTGYEEPKGLSFLFYLFAKINKHYSIEKHPFPVILQDYIDYPW